MTLTPEILENLKKAAIERGGAVVGIEKAQFLELVDTALEWNSALRGARRHIDCAWPDNCHHNTAPRKD